MRYRQWGLITTEYRREFYAMYNLEHAAQNYGKAKVYLPLLQEGKKISPLFPSYLFVQFRRDFGWKWAASIKGVKSVMCVGGETLTPVPDKVIKDLKARETDGAVILSPPKLQSDAAVKVLHGAFIGERALYEGMVGKDRALVLLRVLGEEVRAVVSARSLEAI